MRPPNRPKIPMRRWQRRKHARTDEILDAAAQVMAERGNYAMKVSEIAERAGIAKGTIYLYFTSKDALLETLAARLAQQASAAAE